MWEGVNTAGARQVNVTDGRGDYMALLIIKQKAPKGNTAVRSGSINKVGKAGNSVYKFKLDRLKPRSKRSLGSGYIWGQSEIWPQPPWS